MKYQQFIQLTSEEKRENLALLLQLDSDELYSGDAAARLLAVDLIAKTDPLVITKLALQFSQIDELCKDAKLDLHWSQVWRAANDAAQVAKVHLFDLIKGQCLYKRYLQELATDNLDDAKFYLQEAAKLQFLAAQTAYYSSATLIMENTAIFTTPQIHPQTTSDEKFSPEMASKYY